MDSMADDVVEMLDGLGITEPVVVGGLSMGGYVAIALALKHPSRVRALMLMDTRAAADTAEAASLREQTAQSVLKAGHPGAMIETMTPRLFGKSTVQRAPGLVLSLQESMERTSASGVAGALWGMAVRPDRTEQLSEISVPTLVIVGEEDVISPPEEARSIADALPLGKLEVIPAAGHLSPYENPKVVNAVVLEFLNELN